MTTLRRATMAALTTAVFAGSLALGAADSTAPELAAALQKKYDAIKDFSADFSHTYEGGVLHKQITERGHLLVKKPGKMRWDYSTPETKQFVSDGLKMYSYIPQDKQVIVATVPPDEDAPTPTLFLAGKGNVTRDFTPAAGR
jgi:outer membrane lipoprotein carrier protein